MIRMTTDIYIDQDIILEEIPLTGDISTMELFKIFYPNLIYKTGMKEYVMLNAKIIKLRNKSRIQTTRVINRLKYYKRK